MITCNECVRFTRSLTYPSIGHCDLKLPGWVEQAVYRKEVSPSSGCDLGTPKKEPTEGFDAYFKRVWLQRGDR